MNASLQLPLDLPHRPALSGDDFFVAPANSDAIAFIDRWPDWPGPGAVIHGDSGCGKSHLALVFAAKSRAPVIRVDDLVGDANEIAGNHAVIIVDDADRAVDGNGAAQETLFHLYNLARETGQKLLLTARAPSSRWNIALADLRSRLSTLEQIAIQQPDDALLGVLLMKLFADRQLKVDPDVVGYLVARMDRSAAAAAAVVEALDREALSKKRRITVPLARDVLDRLRGDDQLPQEL